MSLFQGMFPALGYTTFSIFDFGKKFSPVITLIKNGIGEWVFEENDFNSLAKDYFEK